MKLKPNNIFFIQIVLFFLYFGIALLAVGLFSDRFTPFFETHTFLMVVGCVVVFVVLPLAIFMVPEWLGMHEKKVLEQIGVPAQAKILSVSATGLIVNDNPAVKLQLQVLTGGDGYRAELEIVVSRLDIPQAGEIIDVKYDPQNPQNVTMV